MEECGEEEGGAAEVERGDCDFVELQFTDVVGAIKSVVLPARRLGQALRHGCPFDGSALGLSEHAN